MSLAIVFYYGVFEVLGFGMEKPRYGHRRRHLDVDAGGRLCAGAVRRDPYRQLLPGRPARRRPGRCGRGGGATWLGALHAGRVDNGRRLGFAVHERHRPDQEIRHVHRLRRPGNVGRPVHVAPDLSSIAFRSRKRKSKWMRCGARKRDGFRFPTSSCGMSADSLSAQYRWVWPSGCW